MIFDFTSSSGPLSKIPPSHYQLHRASESIQHNSNRKCGNHENQGIYAHYKVWLLHIYSKAILNPQPYTMVQVI